MKRSINILCIALVIMMLCACTKKPVSTNKNTNTAPHETAAVSDENDSEATDPAPTATIPVVKPWDGNIATSFSGGSGTENDPYQIATAEELAYLASRVNDAAETYENKYIELTSDIDLGGLPWTPIGLCRPNEGRGQCFMGSFNGDNHAITNLLLDDSSAIEAESSLIRIGLFGSVEEGIIENLTVRNSNMNYSVSSGDNVRSGIIVGYVADGIVRNCSAVGNITTEYEISDKSEITDEYSSHNLGGVVGMVYCSEVSSCHFEGSIDASTSISADELAGKIQPSVGGVIGVSNLSKVLDCSSNGYVNTNFMTGKAEVENSSNRNCNINLGGIIGLAFGSEIERNISNASVEAYLDASNVVPPENVYYMWAAAGGIVGAASNVDDENIPSSIKECVSMGNISIDCSVGVVRSGGLVGEMAGSELMNSYSIGNVTSSAEDSIQIGGISGACWSSSLENCYSSSRLSNSDSIESYEGGIIGYSDKENSNTVNNCYYKRTAVNTINGIGTPLSKSQMEDPSYYSGFDFDDVWEISDNPEHGYLKLKNVVYD